MLYALVEGLCGVKDRGVTYDHLELSPRWTVAGERNVSVTIKYPASYGYVSYLYSHEEDFIRIHFTGSHNYSEIRLLMPGGLKPVEVKLNGESVLFGAQEIEGSRYMVLEGVKSVMNQIEVRF